MTSKTLDFQQDLALDLGEDKLQTQELIPEVVPAALGNVLRKPVDTLAMTPADEGKISVIERKLYFTLMWFAQKQGWAAGQECFEAPLAEVLKKMNYNSRNMKLIRDALSAMTTTAVEWQSPTANEGSKWGVSGMIAHAEISSKKSGSTLEWSYSPKIRPAILNPIPFARGSLEVQDTLKSYSALALYDICARYLSSATGLTPRRHWSWWRPVLTGNGDGLDHQPEYKVFNRDVIKKAMAEINAKTAIDVQMIAHKAGRNVNDIQFRATRKKTHIPSLQNIKSDSGLKEIGRAISLGVAQRQAEIFIEEHGESTVSKGLDILEERIKNPWMRQVDNPKSFLKTVFESTPIDAQTGALVDTQKEHALEKQKMLELLELYRDKKLQEAWELYSESPLGEMKNLEELFGMDVVAKLPISSRNLFAEKKLKSASMRGLMKAYLAKHFFGNSWNMPSDDELLKFSLGLVKTKP